MAAQDTTLTSAISEPATTRQASSVNQVSSSDAAQGGINVGETERYASVIGGSALALYGLSRKSLGGLVLGLLGGALLYRGATGHCNTYGALGINTAHGGGKAKGLLGGRGTRVVKSVTINRSRSEVYRFWRNFENLPQFMNHLESVTVINDKRSHWVAKAPAGTTVEWDAEIVRESENRLIAWRSLQGADVDNAGAVKFERLPGGRATRLTVSLEYIPPAGMLGAAVAKFFGEEPAQQLEDDLTRFKEIMEPPSVNQTATIAASAPTGTDATEVYGTGRTTGGGI